MPGGVSANLKYFGPHPIVLQRADGAVVWDVDENRYIDCQLSFGALILGHGHPVVRRAVEEQLRRDGTTAFGAPHPGELEMAQLLLDVFPSGQQVRFVNSGLEATLLALRIAKAATGKRRLAKFEGHYHGAHEQVLYSYRPPLGRAGSAQNPATVPDSPELEDAAASANCLILPFNDWESTERLLRRHADELYAVILEPIPGGVLVPEDGFLTRLADLTRGLGIPLIFDEVKTGFRLAAGGAQQTYGVMPDLTSLGKILGGGYPIGAVLGRRDLMELVDPSERSHGLPVFHSGTFNGHPVSIAAGMAVLRELQRPGTHAKLDDAVAEVKEHIRAAAARAGTSIQLPGIGSTFSVVFADGPVRSYRDIARADHAARASFDMRMMNAGVFLAPGDRLNFSTAHSPDVLEEFRSVVEGVIAV